MTTEVREGASAPSLFPSFDVGRLFECLDGTKWSAPSDVRLTRAHHLYRQASDVDDLARFKWVLSEFAPVKVAWLSWIEPGGFVVPHKDGGPYMERWQVPIQTSGRFVQDGELLGQVAGVPFRVEQWRPHEVVNDGDRPRVHLVIDRDILANDSSAPFVVLGGNDG